MEQVFSSAYITIAASCASGTEDGFLKPRMDRQCVRMADEIGAPYYLCEAIDNFSADVDQGELNKRGWVLQERALSRRTIYFTDKQSYWECGGGVRCETLTTMKKYVGSPSSLHKTVSSKAVANLIAVEKPPFLEIQTSHTQSRPMSKE